MGGECAKRAVYHIEDVLNGQTLEDRIYRHRCVEAWSMVIPWVGFPLADFIRKCEPTSKAKFVEFTTLYDPKQMPGVRYPVLDWPYVEGLRMDEALHPLAILAVVFERARYRNNAVERSAGGSGPGGGEASMPVAPFRPTDPGLHSVTRLNICHRRCVLDPQRRDVA